MTLKQNLCVGLVLVIGWFGELNGLDVRARDGDSVTLKCDSNTVIQVTAGYYGTTGVTNPALACSDPNALEIITNQCGRKQSCTLAVSDATFNTTTCPNRREALIASYACVATQYNGLVINARDGESVILQCDQNYLIKVNSAYYGSIGQTNPALACSDPSALVYLKSQCNKKQNCTFAVSDTIFKTSTCASFRRERLIAEYDCIEDPCLGYECPNGGTCEVQPGNNYQPRCVNGRGPTYVRWGKTSCPSSATKLYDGRMAGATSSFNTSGSGANYLCLPTTPEYALKITAVDNQTRGEIYGAEYGDDESGSPYASNAVNKDIPCAVCQTVGKDHVLMIPATRTCISNWKTEYIGYLVSAAQFNTELNQTDFRQPSSYECMDETPDFVNDGNDDDGAVVYPVSGRQKSLPNYTDNKVLSCVICSI